MVTDDTCTRVPFGAPKSFGNEPDLLVKVYHTGPGIPLPPAWDCWDITHISAGKWGEQHQTMWLSPMDMSWKYHVRIGYEWIYPLVSSNLVGWNIRFIAGKSRERNGRFCSKPRLITGGPPSFTGVEVLNR